MPLHALRDCPEDILSVAGVQQYLVRLRRPTRLPGEQVGVMEQNLLLGELFVRELRHLARANNLEAEIEDGGHARRLPMVSIAVTPRVAEMVGTMPQVEAVVPDNEGVLERSP